MVKSLDKKWKEFLFAFSGFGPNLLMIIMGAYYSDALNPAALESGEQFQTIVPGVCFILPGLFPILYALGKVFDGIIDIPFAHITDSLSTKWGKRRPAIAVCLVPMILSFAMCWIPIAGADGQLVNTLWFTFWCIIFYASYTMCLIAYYGSLSNVCTSEPQRLRVSGYKSFFDTICYCLVYALVPVLLSALKLQIDEFVFICLPLMFTMVIPLALIKEGEKYGYPENNGGNSVKINMKESVSLTFGNSIFRRWLFVNCCSFFGLQMFLSAMNGMIIGGMGLTGTQMAILNTFAFGPVPVMLYLFNKVKAKKGVRASYQSCLLMFAVAILSFFVGSRFVLGEGNIGLKMLIGIVGGICGSWSIGVFFMMPYLAPAQISSVEEKLTGKNHSAMYFAGNAVATSIVGAVSGNLIYEYIKNIFVSKDIFGFVWASTSQEAYLKLHGLNDLSNVSEEQLASVYNFGNLVVPFIVCVTCLAGFFLAFKMPKDFTPMLIAKEFQKQDPTLDISCIEDDEVKGDRGDIIFVNIGLCFISFFIFGFIWVAFMIKSIKELGGKIGFALSYILSCFVPFASLILTLRMRSQLIKIAREKGIEIRISRVVLILSSIVCFVLPLNIVALSILQFNINKIYKAD